MTCEKTGAGIYLHEYNVWAHCDAHSFGHARVFRIVAADFIPLKTALEEGRVLHYDVYGVAEWWDKDKPVQTLVSMAWHYHGMSGTREYEGED